MASAYEFESAVIGALLVDTRTNVPMAYSAGVSSDWFAEPVWKLAWTAIDKIWRKNGGVEFDQIIIIDEARRITETDKDFSGVELNAEMVCRAIDSCSFAEMLPSYLAKLRGEVIVRKMHDAIRVSCDDEAAMTAEEACGALAKRLLDVLSNYTVSRAETFVDLSTASLKRFEDAHRIYMIEKRLNYVPGMPTPWWSMTKLLGGIQPGFHIIGARTSVGKTSFALQMVRFLAEHGFKVGFNSLDMNIRSFVDRFFAEHARVSLFKAQFGHTREDQMTALRSSGKTIASWPITAFVEYDVDKLYTWCRVRKSSGQLDALFVDFVQLLSYAGADRATDTGRMTRVSKTIKRIVNELDLPVIALSQLNRECEKDGGREPVMADLRESGALEQDATTVSLLYHDSYTREKWKNQIATRSGTPIELADGNERLAARITPTFWKLCKNQNGECGKLPFVVYQNYFAWMLGDTEATPGVRTVGNGVSQKQYPDYSPLFERVHADWRHADFEKNLNVRMRLMAEDLPPSVEEHADQAAPKHETEAFTEDMEGFQL